MCKIPSGVVCLLFHLAVSVLANTYQHLALYEDYGSPQPTATTSKETVRAAKNFPSCYIIGRQYSILIKCKFLEVKRLGLNFAVSCELQYSVLQHKIEK